MSSCVLYAWSQGLCYHDDVVPTWQPSTSFCKTRPPLFLLILLSISCLGHQEASVPSHKQICMCVVRKPVRVALNLLFIHVYFIYQWVMSYRSFSCQFVFGNFSKQLWDTYVRLAHIPTSNIVLVTSRVAPAILQTPSLVIFSSLSVGMWFFLYHGEEGKKKKKK